MAPPGHQTVAFSAPGKVLLAGGYLVLDRQHTGLVFGLSARIHAIVTAIHTGPGVQLTEIVVESPQFVDAQWRYGYHLAPDGGGIAVTQLQTGAEARPNPFVETALSFALTYVAQRTTGLQTRHSIEPARLIILADKAYYSQPATDERRGGRFAKFSVTLGGAHKTGLGSSAALVTSLTAALLAHYLPPEILDVSTAEGRRSLHNLAQAAHCAAQGKVGSGFDVAAAVFGSCQYRRFSPSLLSQLPEPASPGFGAKLVALVDQVAGWDVEVRKDGIDMPQGVVLRMCDVDCGSQTVSMVKKVLSWRAEHQERSTKLWDALQTSNEALAATLCRGDTDALPQMVGDVRRLIRDMSRLSDVPIEPERQTELLDALSEVEGVYGGVVPGAGGFDALALLTRRDDDTKGRVDAFLRRWSQENASKVRLLDVQGEMEGLRRENLDEYEGWL